MCLLERDLLVEAPASWRALKQLCSSTLVDRLSYPRFRSRDLNFGILPRWGWSLRGKPSSNYYKLKKKEGKEKEKKRKEAEAVGKRWKQKTVKMAKKFKRKYLDD